ncbi:pyruvate-formate lyase-activating enzyme [Paenibacillus melissococcoides]|uniref:Pyruvate-formate lyase-activating enzyme n=1 Tax=Paenibacillus melissococcoides TaxID=2912268 RepID=A0ABN8UES7_9BACL|nr:MULTISPECIES: pyruvate-formate lyase-activating enzyme [Paenibacillus]MEB9897439.1 pyruvate-formate lyase-activating enzyme [Bacillus cereus]CAH8248768.1 pyruvate-formate lyase-activating enzyme [Paenibacillus melissococcoides]CAH8249743.1 pyruvate-formate lyase-activating enzyme [Paenibacillus melissococcoides]CAH8713787.1 pyruvate-formate lyase-activating enzyme [Paenibacillus melissococcoides]CAH8720445.1 pyruvate-formate lyase-activating enzyme [Paenibacillus melissococcoides]
MTAGLERAKTIELLYFMNPYPKRDTAEFQGKYHHLGFNWRAFPLKGDLESLANGLYSALQGVDKEECYDFYAHSDRVSHPGQGRERNGALI